MQCKKHRTKLEPDGVCHRCMLEKSEKTAKQSPAFAKKLAKRILGEKRKKK